MADVEQLERLNRLRESGALTDEEFQNEKARLFAEPRSRRGLIVGLVAALVVLAVAGYLWMQAERSGDAAASSSENAVANADSAVGNQTSEASEDNLYAWATSFEVLGMNPAYLETRLGPPKVKEDGFLSYDVGGCTVLFYVKGTSIESYDAAVNERCHPVVRGHTLTQRTTFGSLMESLGGTLGADCVWGCGNAYDPPTYLITTGGRASPDVLFYSVSLEGGGDYPTGDWADAIRAKHGLGTEDIPDDFDIFACVTDPPAPVESSLKKARIEGVQVGYGIADKWCGRE